MEGEWTAYSLAGLGVFLVLRHVKATTKFTHVSNIPKHFFSKNYRLQGKVRKVSECGQLLVEHVPIIRLNLFTRDAESNHLLAVNVAGVSVTSEAVQWLRGTAQDKNVWFRLLQANDASVDCDVVLKLSLMRRSFSLSEELIRKGVCAVKHFPTPPTSPAYNHLLTRLLTLEHKAQGRGKGLWGQKSYRGQGWLSRWHWIKQRLNFIKRLFRRKDE